ncbi:MAG: imidazolonepropionase [Candidatus Marinimicrobia bacterium]|nr:imidazolonepropionase [Candidatus Neomarinimicrobiota bacterium]
MKKKKADIVIVGASELITVPNTEGRPKIKNEMNDLGIIKEGALAIKDGLIADVGTTENLLKKWHFDFGIDARDKVVMPGFVDCHTHSLFAGSREEEFAQKISGVNYLNILEKGGGILKTVGETRDASKDSLSRDLFLRMKKFLENGTTTVEVKSGYTLSCQEIDMLDIVARTRSSADFVAGVMPDIIPTFLGAHVFPKDQPETLYMEDLMWMIGEVSSKKLAEYCDVFCDNGAFRLKDTQAVLRRAQECGIKIKMHVGQFGNFGGVQLGLSHRATSLDHLENIRNEEIVALAKSETIGVLLPACSFHLMTNHYAPARKMIDAGVRVALATDFNPGSAPTMSMQMVIALACRQMKMTPAESITASTINSAYAIDMAGKVGSLEIGKQADIIILDIQNHLQLPYWFGENLTSATIKKGKIV